MSLILFTIFLPFSGTLILLANYYRKLFSLSKSSFKRDEITDLQQILKTEFYDLIGSDRPTAYLVLGTGFILGLILNHIGGLYGAHYESYFFNSIAIPGIAAMGLPYLRDNFQNEIKEVSFLKKLFQHDTLFLYSISVTTMTQIMVTFGIYHSINFLWVIVNYIGILLLVVYNVYSQEKKNN